MKHFCLALAALVCAALPAAAQDIPDPLVTFTLRAQADDGGRVTLAVEQDIAPGWHTYYREPGDSGLATTVDWDLPPGFAVGPLQWPEPETIREGPLTTYGYHGRPVLLQALTPPTGWDGGAVELTARIEALACRDICVPVFATQNITVDVPPSAGGAENPPLTSPSARGGSDGANLPPLEQGGGRGGSVWTALLLAFAGGLILNLMPCVFPVLALKGLSLVQHRTAHPAWHGAAYAAGVIATFLAVAAALLAVKGAGAAAGWGFHLQEPWVVAALAWLMFAVGLNLAGVFELRLPFAASQPRAAGFAGDFATGALVTLVATPCTAPFMAAALGWALVQPAPAALAVFAALGAGLAAPYVALTLAPGLARALPRPGPWMERLRHALAWPMFAAAIWLAWVLARAAGPDALGWALIGALLIALAARARAWWLALALVPLALLTTPTGPAQGFGQPWSPAALDAALDGGGPVFVEMTADWCITCKANHAVAIDRAATRALFAQRGVTFLVGDWTRRDADITAYLAAFDRQGVPLYVYYPGAGAPPVVLPQILSGPGAIARAMQEADARKDAMDTSHLTPEQRRVTQDGGTERAFTGAYWNHHEEGIYVDVVSGQALFASSDKFDSGTGWPSFTRPIGGVVERADASHGMTRTEVISARAGSHLGHVFDDGPGGARRYCINSAALRFVPRADMAREGYAEHLDIFAQGQ
jgi:methionine-R-sulfoxide reductase